MPSSKENYLARHLAMTEEERNAARKKDAMRKRESRAINGVKRRKDLSPERLKHVREMERKRWNMNQRNMTEEEREKVREKDRQRKSKYRRARNIKMKKDNNQSERKKIKHVLRMRKARLLLSEEMRILERIKAQEGMVALRKVGRLRKYMQRKKRGFCEMKWNKFLAENPKFMALEEKKNEEMELDKKFKLMLKLNIIS